jgi:hypothetical protein
MPGLYPAPAKNKKKSGTAGSTTGLADAFRKMFTDQDPSLGGWGTMAQANMSPPTYTKENAGNIDALANIYGMMTGGGALNGTAPQAMAAAPGSGSIGGAGAAASGLAPDPWSGFAGQYAAGASNMLWENPEIMIRDMMKQMGLNPNEGMMDVMEGQFGPLMQYIQMLGLGTGDPNSMTPETLINFTGDWVKDMMTPGKGGGDVWKMIGSVLDAPKGSALAASLESGTPQQQAANLNNLIRAATATMPPIFQQALGDLLEDKTTDWLSQKAKGTGGYRGFLSDWLQKGGKGILG